jgi:molybdopterin synthase catalytic subunit/molybdopterin converting factor small subunit
VADVRGISRHAPAAQLYAVGMQVRIRLFAALRERAGAEELTLELDHGATVADALRELHWLTGDLRAAVAVNRDYASAATVLHADDELALIPPVSGGSTGALAHVAISSAPLSLQRISELVTDPRAGAVVTFQGVTREVPALEYEAYAEMAVEKLEAIAREVAERHGLCAVAVEHRVGVVELSQPSVVIAVSAPHRAEAFAGAREIIDTLKLIVPIWKREEGEWVKGHPPR